MTLKKITELSMAFRETLAAAKQNSGNINWYPYDSLSNFTLLQSNFKGKGQEMFSDFGPGQRIVDIGAADGETSFFLSSQGADVTIVDNASTNYNNCTGIKFLQENLDNRVKLIERDLDFNISPLGEYDLAIFLGILYHLRNPMMALTNLAESAEYMVTSTAIISRLEPGGISIEDYDLAALLPARQLNDDPTNFWYMTPQSLRVLLRRSGWVILDEFRLGDVGVSNPKGGDERMYAYCRRVPNWRDLRLHHDF